MSCFFLKDKSLIGLKRLKKIGIKHNKVKTPIISNKPKYTDKITDENKNRIVATEAFQIRAKTTKGIKQKLKICGERAKKAPIKVPIPLPPAPFKKQDQLWPTTAPTPAKI